MHSYHPLPTETNPVIQGLNAFIRRYYKNQLIRGVIYVTAVLASLFICVALSEHFAFFPSIVRAVLFWAYLALSILLTGWCVVRPFLRMHRLGRVISYQQAAVIIGDHFPEVADQLLNLLQLKQLPPTGESDLIVACIAQKTARLSPIPFSEAVNLGKNRKYARYAALPLLLLAVLLLVAPATIVSSSHRIVDYRTRYQRPAPFRFVIENPVLETTARRDFTLVVTTEGGSIPSEVHIQLPQGRYKMHADSRTQFSYVISKPVNDINFSLSGGGVTSGEYRLAVRPEPVVVDFTVALSYPAYIHRDNEVLINDGDITVPRGTYVRWNFQTRDVDTLHFSIDGGPSRSLAPDGGGRVSVVWRAMESSGYCFFVGNSHTRQSDTLCYSVSVIPDAAPAITVTDAADSTAPGRRLFYGRIKDDYGFSALRFIIAKQSPGDTVAQEIERRPLALSQDAAQEFYHHFDVNEVKVEAGDRLSYYFEVCDNNAVDGSQCSRSQLFEESIPTEKELRRQQGENSRQAESHARQSLSELRELQQEIEAMMRQLVDKKELNWQDKQQLQQLYNRQKEVRESLQQMREQMRENRQLQDRFGDPSEQLLEKQRELDRLMNEVLDDKMKQMMSEMEKLLQEVDKKKLQNQLENIQLDTKEMEKQIDRDLALMKRLEMEKRVETAVQQIEDLAAQQERLSEEVDNSRRQDQEQLLQRQQELSQRYRELQDEIRSIERDYKQLEESPDFKSDRRLEQSIEQHQSAAEQQLQRGSRRNASQRQRSAAEQLHKLSEQLAEQQQQLEQQNLAEDAAMVRQMLKNLLHLSFSQEALIGQTSETFIQDPQYQDIISRQNSVKSDFRIVEDSLGAIARRQVQVASAVNKEIAAVNIHVAKSLSDLLQMNQSFYGSAKNSAASRSMQYAMTSLNNLSLILAESLEQMQRQMAQNQQNRKNGSCKRKSGRQQGSCSNPGQGKPSAKSIKQMQDELNRQMEALRKQLDKQGKADGNGRKRLGERNPVSEEFARMAAQQEAIRRLMQQYGQELKQGNARDAKMAREIDAILRQMEQTETDLVNKTITQQTLQRQRQIMSRMLEHERAEMQRDKEERRESREAADTPPSVPPRLPQFERLRRSAAESLQSTPLPLTPFYRSKADDYLFR
ncbi:MAG: hypothetical protein AUK63_1531 [bacterium P3]|nr:MAG: hypothetical protein AUK63_1531 [bacterium P3]KWW41073.1 MAG: hypothetical protein F083_1240 [bacterium F083]